MTLLEKQQFLTSRLGLIENVQERLAAVVDRVRKMPPLDDTERVESNRIQGCISRVWLVSSREASSCRFRVDADSVMVRGLAALVCEFYDGALPREIVAEHADILDLLKLNDQLTSTRRNGLEQLRETIRQFAASCLAP